MVALGTTALATWVGYTFLQRYMLNQSTYLAMQLLAETRLLDADQAQARRLLNKVMTTTKSTPTSIFEELPSSRRLIPLGTATVAAAATAETNSVPQTQQQEGSYYYQCIRSDDDDDNNNDSLYLQTTNQGNTYTLFGQQRPFRQQSLRELVMRHSKKFQIYEDLVTRYQYMETIRQSILVQGQDVPRVLQKGVYTFCFRDYVNHEEVLGMMVRRRGIEQLLVKPTQSGHLIVSDSDNDDDSTTTTSSKQQQQQQSCILREYGRFLLWIPIQIDWYGHVNAANSCIDWTSSSFRVGWKRLGKTFSKPKVAEKLRKDPWQIRLPKEDYSPTTTATTNLWAGSGQVLVLHRVGSGCLVYGRNEILAREDDEKKEKD